jgi:DNA repair protein RAD16
LNNYAHIFDILIRLRQAVDHPYLVIHSDSRTADSARDIAFARDLGESSAKAVASGEDCDGECALCSECVDEVVRSNCGHQFCRLCITEYMSTMSSENPSATLLCPDCQSPLTLQLNTTAVSDTVVTTATSASRSIWDTNKRRRKSILDKLDLSAFQTSTKMEALMEVRILSSDTLGYVIYS